MYDFQVIFFLLIQIVKNEKMFIITIFEGWTTGFRSIYWYQSGATYVQFSFVSMTRVASILMGQMNHTQFTTFSKFQISFSNDGVSYAFLPEVIKYLLIAFLI